MPLGIGISKAFVYVRRRQIVVANRRVRNCYYNYQVDKLKKNK